MEQIYRCLDCSWLENALYHAQVCPVITTQPARIKATHEESLGALEEPSGWLT